MSEGSDLRLGFAEEPPILEDERRCMKSVGNSYALISSVVDLNDRGIHLRWSFSLSLFCQRGSSAESLLSSFPLRFLSPGGRFAKLPLGIPQLLAKLLVKEISSSALCRNSLTKRADGRVKSSKACSKSPIARRL